VVLVTNEWTPQPSSGRHYNAVVAHNRAEQCSQIRVQSSESKASAVIAAAHKRLERSIALDGEGVAFEFHGRWSSAELKRLSCIVETVSGDRLLFCFVCFEAGWNIAGRCTVYISFKL
jgi:hypothetical protein